MKRLVSVICGIGLSVLSFAQTQEKLLLPIATDKTTSLIFPFSVRYVDRGTKDVLVQQVKEADNLLLVKAGTANFKATNLSVVTADGQVYSFEVSYESQPAWTVFHLRPVPNDDQKEISFPGDLMNAKDLESYSKGILDNPKFIRGITDSRWDISVKITGIYIKDNVIFCQMVLDNQSPIDYDIDFIRFYIRDKRKGKRTASQELEVTPLYTTGNLHSIRSFGDNMLVFGFEKFTIPDAKDFFIQIAEKNGGRHLRMKVTNGKLLKAKMLPSYK